MAFNNADHGQEKNSHVTNTVMYQYPKGSFNEDTVTYVTKEEKKNRRRSVSTSVSKPVNFEPDAAKIPEYYEKFFLKELKCRGLSNKRITMDGIHNILILPTSQ